MSSNVVVFDSKLNENGEMEDLPKGIQGKSILFIGAREGQVLRVQGLGHIACGWWELVDVGVLTAGYAVNTKFLEQFDVIIFEHPRRVYAPIRHVYKGLIKKISEQLF